MFYHLYWIEAYGSTHTAVQSGLFQYFSRISTEFVRYPEIYPNCNPIILIRKRLTIMFVCGFVPLCALINTAKNVAYPVRAYGTVYYEVMCMLRYGSVPYGTVRNYTVPVRYRYRYGTGMVMYHT